MQALIQNYATPNSTEPLYVSECLNAIDDCKSTVWNSNQISAFDIFDIVQPDVFITHYRMLSNDLIKYLSGSKIECVFNITDAQQDHIDQLDEVFRSHKIKCPFIFTNQPRLFNTLLQRKTKLISVMHGADIFLPAQGITLPEYQLEMGLITNYKCDTERLNKLLGHYSCYHTLSTDQELSNHVDISTSAMPLYAIYNRYKKMIITHESNYIPQYFFDSLLYGNETYYLTRHSGQQEKTNGVIKEMLQTKCSLACDHDEIEKGKIDFAKLRNQLLTKHTCANRVKRILSRLSCNVLADKLDNLAKEMVHDNGSA